MHLAQFVATTYLAVSANIVLTKLAPVLNPMLHYGKVAQATPAQGPPLVRKLAAVTVPKSWFLHYYFVFLALMWGMLVVCREPILLGTKYLFVWFLLTIQATRRALESVFVSKWSALSRMHVTHYMVGLGYYVGLSIACYCGLTSNTKPIELGATDYLLAAAFGHVSWDQARNHLHLALLVKYSVPTRGLFSAVSCAHYLDELVLYLILTVYVLIHGPVGDADWAIVASYVFAVTNLTITAVETNRYYRTKFDGYNVKYAIVPYVV